MAEISLRLQTLMKYSSLTILMIQTTATVLLMRYTRSQEESRYLASTAVFMAEVFKVIVCLGILWKMSDFNISSMMSSIWQEVVLKTGDTLKIAVPSGLYVVQNNLLYIALTNLDAATYQITYQLKILTTALFSMLLLGKRLDSIKWVSLFTLMVGVALVQIPSDDPKSSRHVIKMSNGTEVVHEQSQLLGVSACLAACVFSGFAGVYFEKLLKTSQQSLWLRNLQMGTLGMFFSSWGAFVIDYDVVRREGFFKGYNNLTWLVIALQAFGGLVVALVIKYTDNIVKSFAASLSIVLSSFCSYFFIGDLHVSRYFFLGATFVIGSSFLYGTRGQETVPGTAKHKDEGVPKSGYTQTKQSPSHAKAKL